RSIIVAMKPRRAGDPKEYAADFNHCDTDTFARVRSQLMRWAADNAEAVAKATPEIPSGFHNRRRANWVPLLAIAEAGDWKTRTWRAALAIEAVADTFDPSIGIELLRAIKTAFGARNADRITSADLIAELLRDETAPWATYNKGKPISQRQVASLLKPYGIKPKVIRLDDGNTPRGYLLEWFIDVFNRFCTSSSARDPNLSATSATDLFSQDFSQFSSATSPVDVADKNDEKPSDINDVADVADKNQGEAEKRHIAKGGSGATAHVRTAKPRSDDLPYTSPVVPVPDMGPDSLDEHGAPRANSSDEPGVSRRRIRDLAEQYQELAYAKAQANDGDTLTAELDAWLRQHLIQEGVLPQFVEVEFERVMVEVFQV